MKHQLPKLKFSMDSLAPAMSHETLKYHYGKHHAGYINNLNELIKNTQYEDLHLEKIVLSSSGDVFNNAAQAWNHAFFWNSLTPTRLQRPASGSLLKSINETFYSFGSFQKVFKDIATKFFGSGWIWLVKDEKGALAIMTTSNAENPLRTRATPLLVCDLWEHAHYIDYRNDRAKFIDGFQRLANWKFAGERFEDIAIKKAA